MEYQVTFWNSGNSCFKLIINNVEYTVEPSKSIHIDVGYICHCNLLNIFLEKGVVNVINTGFSKYSLVNTSINNKDYYITIHNRLFHDLILVDEPFAEEYIFKIKSIAIVEYKNWKHIKKNNNFLQIEIDFLQNYLALYNSYHVPFDIKI